MNFNGAAALSLRVFPGIFRLPPKATFAKLLIHGTQGVEQHVNILVASFPFEVVGYFLCLVCLCFSQLCSNLLFHLHQGKRERRGSGRRIFDGRNIMFPTLNSQGAPCYLHPALPLRILTTGLPEKEIRIIQMSI